ncbi:MULTISPECIES: restriction endonuclease [Acidobacteriaceae]|uniref:restriction endonuclease n=1 Tax=Acidobacteriaceae TaxID=204434 RepID=UPI00131CA16E|nr:MULTISPECIES: restriction endonuclease [Acidobacteriaceae]MDW5266078.1 restriction endonuclease [Edaphobacter sp.]
MNDQNVSLQQFVDAYRTHKIPPPHFLLIGADEARRLDVAEEFAQHVGVRFTKVDAARIAAQGDLTLALTAGGVVYISNIQSLKKPFVEKLEHDLPHGEYEVVIGLGPSARNHKMDISTTTLIGSCQSKYECPAPLLRVIENVFAVEPATTEGLIELLEETAWKDQIALDRDASELVVSISGGRTDTMLYQFRRLCGVIDQIKTTNRPQITKEEMLIAFARLRIKAPSATRPSAISSIHALSGQEFEHVIKELLTVMGFQAEMTATTGDGGIDLIATLDKPFIGGRYLFQCKRYSDGNMVGASEVRDFYGAVMADRAIKGIFITTSDFTNQAKEFATQSGLELINMPKLIQLLEECGLMKYDLASGSKANDR